MNKKVILPIGVIVVIISIFLFFKFFHKECVPPEITFGDDKHLQGQMIKFKSNNSEEGDNIVWDFGDSTSGKGIEIPHKYKKEGTYTVKATKDENCVSTKEITVLANRKRQKITPNIIYPPQIHANESVTFTDATNEATIWNWAVTGTSEVGSDKSFTTQFSKAGKYTIEFYLKGNNGITGDTTFTVDVIEGGAKSASTKTVAPPANDVPKPAPPAPAKTEPKPAVKAESKPEPKPAPTPEPKAEVKPKPEAKAKPAGAAAPVYMSDAEFTSSFITIANALIEDDNASNEWRDKIVPQTGEKGSMKVIIKIGGQSLEKTLESFKKTQLISSEPYKIESVKDIKRASKNGPITEITIGVSKGQ